jgi:hypothetical protein
VRQNFLSWTRFLSAFPVHVPNLIFLPLHSISYNDIGAQGATAIGEALKHNRSLTNLK